MAGTCVFELEGVLCKGYPPNDAPIWIGTQMYHALATQFRVVIDSVHDDINEIEHWLQVNALKRHTLILHRAPEMIDLEEAQVRSVHLIEWRSQGFDVALYVTTDPVVAAHMMRMGVPTLLLAHPQFSRPEYRPDHEHELRRWDDIEDEITTQMQLREPPPPRVDAEMDA